MSGRTGQERRVGHSARRLRMIVPATDGCSSSAAFCCWDTSTYLAPARIMRSRGRHRVRDPATSHNIAWLASPITSCGHLSKHGTAGRAHLLSDVVDRPRTVGADAERWGPSQSPGWGLPGRWKKECIMDDPFSSMRNPARRADRYRRWPPNIPSGPRMPLRPSSAPTIGALPKITGCGPRAS